MRQSALLAAAFCLLSVLVAPLAKAQSFPLPSVETNSTFDYLRVRKRFQLDGILDLPDGSLDPLVLSSPVPPLLGGTGLAGLPVNEALIGNGSSVVSGVAPGPLGNLMISDGTHWTSQAQAPPTPTRPLMPNSDVVVATTCFDWQDGLADPLGRYGYAFGFDNAHHQLVDRVNLINGANTTLNFNVTSLGQGPVGVVSPDGTLLYVFSVTTGDCWKVNTSTMAIVGHVVLSPAPSSNNRGPDISLDGTKIVYKTGADQNVHILDTSAMTTTSFAAGHSSGSNVSAVCFAYGGPDIFVGYGSSANVDLYTGAGSWSSVFNTAIGGIHVDQMRSGLNGYLFIADTGNSQFVLVNTFVGPTVTTLTSTGAGNCEDVGTNIVSPEATTFGEDAAIFSFDDGNVYKWNSITTTRGVVPVRDYIQSNADITADFINDGSQRALITVANGNGAGLLNTIFQVVRTPN